jgi:alkaline phosphatase D
MRLERRHFLKSLGVVTGASLIPVNLEAKTGPLKSLTDIKRKVLDRNASLDSLCFGSCNRESRPQDFWTVISGFNPDLFIAAGDNIYADTTRPEIMLRKYMELKNNPYYRDFIENIPMLGTWDDHDFGWNNTGRFYKMKVESQAMFCDFFDEPIESPRRNQEGIYTSYDLEEGRVKVILLDVRYHRDDPSRFRCPGPDGADILGPKQWEWFEHQLSSSKALVNLIVTPVGAIGDSLNVTEDWDKFPCSLQRLKNMLEEIRPSGVIFLSGDKHFGGIFPRTIGNSQFPVVEIMSSGLTHSAPVISHPIIRARYDRREIYLRRNFGRLEFHLDQGFPEVVLQIYSIDGELQLELNWPISEARKLSQFPRVRRFHSLDI